MSAFPAIKYQHEDSFTEDFNELLDSLSTKSEVKCCDFNPLQMVAIAEVLYNNTSIKTLNLWGADPGELGLIAAFRALRSNKTVTTLNLAGQAKDPSARALAFLYETLRDHNETVNRLTLDRTACSQRLAELFESFNSKTITYSGKKAPPKTFFKEKDDFLVKSHLFLSDTGYLLTLEVVLTERDEEDDSEVKELFQLIKWADGRPEVFHHNLFTNGFEIRLANKMFGHESVKVVELLPRKTGVPLVLESTAHSRSGDWNVAQIHRLELAFIKQQQS